MRGLRFAVYRIPEVHPSPDEPAFIPELGLERFRVHIEGVTGIEPAVPKLPIYSRASPPREPHTRGCANWASGTAPVSGVAPEDASPVSDFPGLRWVPTRRCVQSPPDRSRTCIHRSVGGCSSFELQGNGRGSRACTGNLSFRAAVCFTRYLDIIFPGIN